MKKMKLKKKTQVRLIAALGVILLSALIYLAGVLYFSGHFLPKTYINDIEVSNLNSETADLKLKQLDPCLNVIERNREGNDTISEKLILSRLSSDIAYDSSSLLSSQNRLGWLTSLFSRKDLSCNKISGSFDPSKIADLIKDLYCLKEENIVRPKDAAIAIENGKAVVKEAIEGSFIRQENVVSLVTEALNHYLEGGSDTLDLTSSYERPASSDTSALQALIDPIQKALDKKIHFNIDSYQEADLKGTEMVSLLKIDGSQLAIDEDALSEYIASFCRKYNVSDYEYIEKSSLKTALEKALLSKEDADIDVNWIIEEGSSLIEVDISEQTLWYYENDVLILTSPVVTGNGNITDATPTGYFEVRKMKQDSWLVGKDYEEHVDYWIGFDETGRVYGFHDASWRDEFGGDIWLSDPSRGCVNMPLSKISQLWDYVNIGTQVYIHE